MLIEFRVENHRSLRDEQVLTMESAPVGDGADSQPRRIPGHAEGLLTVAALYGPKASGKSNVLAALNFMREAVLLSHRSWSPDEGVPRDPFAWGPRRDEPSLFEVVFRLEGVRYQYGFSASDESFPEEWLYAWRNDEQQLWFERDDNGFKFGDNLRGQNTTIAELTRSNALFLSAAAQLKHTQLMRIYSWFRSLETVNVPSGRRIGPRLSSPEIWLARLLDGVIDARQPVLLFDEPPTQSFLDRFRDLLTRADLGIVDLRISRSDPAGLPRRSRYRGIQLKHKSEVDDAWLPLEDESRGTQTLFRLVSPILQAIEVGGILLVDELEASLHPALAQHIVRQFNDPVANPWGAQLIFTTHDTNLLGTATGTPALRREQVWLTEKDDEGATVLYPLTDYKPRNAENLERGYLQGRYGAIPFLGDFHLVGEVSAAAEE